MISNRKMNRHTNSTNTTDNRNTHTYNCSSINHTGNKHARSRRDVRDTVSYVVVVVEVVVLMC